MQKVLPCRMKALSMLFQPKVGLASEIMIQIQLMLSIWALIVMIGKPLILT